MYVCTIIGLMVIGAMIASMIGITTPLRFGKAFVLQDVLDNIMPQLIPLGLTFLCIGCCKRKFDRFDAHYLYRWWCFTKFMRDF